MRIAVGKIVRAHGVKGAVKVLSLTDRKDRFQTLDSVWDSPEDGRRLIIAERGHCPGGLTLRFNGVETPEDAAKLSATIIYAEEELSATAELDEHSAFYYELFRFEVECTPGVVTRVSEVLESPGGQCFLLVRTGGKDYMVPFTEHFVERIDRENGKVVLKNFESIEGNVV